MVGVSRYIVLMVVNKHPFLAVVIEAFKIYSVFASLYMPYSVVLMKEYLVV